MKVSNFTRKNKFINFEQQELSFDKKGIYVIQGNNGVGKSTIIRELIFENQDISFAAEEQMVAYRQNRGSLFSYVSQKVLVTHTDVYHYVVKDNKSITTQQVKQILVELGMNEDSLDTKIRSLSGGEKMKAALASAFLKDTPFIILDEPTNNLDDGSVELLKNYIESVAKQRTILVITHDPRLQFEQYNMVEVREGAIIQTSSEGEVNLAQPNEKNKFSSLKMAFRMQRGLLNHLSRISIVLVLVATVLFNMIEYYTGYSLEESLAENLILAYQADNEYGELNEIYVEGEGITIDSSNYYNMIPYSDIGELADVDGVQEIYILDEDKLRTLYQSFSEMDGLSEIYAISIPDCISENFTEQTGISGMNSLVCGEGPSAHENEIALSQELLIEFYGYTTDNVLEAIGSSIIVDGAEYEVVGITLYDIAWISYQEHDNILFYQYDESDYTEFMERNLAMKAEQDYTLPNEAEDIVIITEAGKEQSVLNYLMMQYPANNYYSSHYSSVWSMQFNSDFMKKNIGFNITIALVFGAVLFMIRRSTIKEDFYQIEDYENYYIMKNRIRRNYLFVKALNYVVCVSIAFLLNVILNHDYAVSNSVLVLDAAVMILPCLIVTFRHRKGMHV